MKILHTADWHIGQFKGPVVDGVNLRLQDTVKCLEYMVEVAQKEKPDIVCISGDIFHQEQIGPVRYSDEMIIATDTITKLADIAKGVIVMRGTPNHDGSGQFRVLDRMFVKTSHVHIITAPTVLHTPYTDIACIPGFDKQEFRAKFPGLSADEENLAWTKYISDMVFALRAECEKTPILMAHYTVPGCNMESGQTSFFTNFEPVIPREALMAARYEAVLLGHIHRPQSLMDSFNDAIEVGAAAGDTSATWQNYANQIWKNGSDELKASLTDPSNPMYETVRSQLPPELAEAIDRAAAETTTDDVTLEGLKASVDGDVDIDKDAWTSKLNEALGDLGETQEVTADHVKIKVDQGDCLWEIGNALGIDWQTIAEQNGIESPYVIHPDQELTISMDTLTAEVDGDKAQAAIEQAMSALDAEGAEMSVTAEGVKVDLADVEVDSDTAAAQIEAALGMESGTLAANGIEVQAGASVTIPSELVTVDTSGMQSATEQAADETETEPIEQEASANVNVTNTTTDTSGMQAQAEEDAQGAVGDVPVEGSANVTFSGTTTDTSGVVEQVTADIESAVSDVPANGHASITLDQSNNAAEIYSLATADVVSAFSETIPADGHVDVTLDQTNNAAAIYSECAGQVQSTFAQGFTASADVAVTLNWHITNPSASISTSSSGSSVSATIAGHASGGEVGLNGAELSWVGEEGLEYIIPTVPARRQRGIELWKSAGRTLGVLGPDDEISAHASGGIVGKEVSNTTPYFDTDSSSQDSEKSEKETVPTNVVSDKSGVVVQVNLSPQFNISDTNDSDVIRLIKAHIKELADDLGSEIATMLSEAYENTPVTT